MKLVKQENKSDDVGNYMNYCNFFLEIDVYLSILNLTVYFRTYFFRFRN